MDNKSRRSLRLNQLLALIGIVFVIVCFYIVARAVLDVQTTGKLSVTANDPRATLSVSGSHTNAAIVGSGHTNIRLNPGNYQVLAKDGNRSGATTVSIKKGQVTNIEISLVAVPRLPSVNDVDFENMNALVDNGLTEDQIKTLKLDFFIYKTTAKSVLVDSGSVQPGPHNPNTTNPFTLNFNVLVDGKPVQATASYSGLEDIRLYLYNSDHQQVFDSYESQSTTNVD